MSAVHDRWELVEPLLFAHSLRAPRAFHEGAITRSHATDLAGLEREHRFEQAAIAHALRMLGAEPRSFRERREPLHTHIRALAAGWLATEGDHWKLRIDPREPGHEIIRWRGVTMLIPPSIVIAGALAETGRSHPCSVQVLSTSIAPTVPVAHLHVHLGPMLAFEGLWAELWNAFLQRGTLDPRGGKGISSIKRDNLPEIGQTAHKREPGKLWQWIMELGFAARVWLSQRERGQLPSVLEAFGRGRIDVTRRGGALLALQSHSHWRPAARRAARALTRERNRDDYEVERKRAAAVREARRAPDSEVHEPAPCPDGPTTPRQADDEIVFLAQALRECRHDESYARVFYQYLRVKVALYRQLVVDPWTTGLPHFLDVVKRDEPYVNVVDDPARLDRRRLDAGLAEKPLEIGALEIHALPSRWIKQRRRAPSPHSWILSFLRARPPQKKREKQDPTGPWAAGTWRRVMAEAGTTGRLLARCMARRPSVLRQLRAIGVMDSERNGPVWLFEPAFRKLLDASAEVAAGHPRLHLQPLRTALHLGEDFDHLLSGLRQIFEPFEWGLISRGDRIGHALALGLSPEAWCTGSPWVRMRPWDRVLDIGFAYWAFEVLQLSLSSNALARMEVDASEALSRIFDDSRGAGALETARDLWRTLPRRPPATAQKRTSDGAELTKARTLLARMLDEPRVGERALEPSLNVETVHDLPLLAAVHGVVLERLAKSHVAIEVNPSSNLLIGGFRSIFQQPAFHADDLPITINADDPLTFGTSLADEYAYAWAGMVVGSKEKPHHATRRLEEAARYSMRYAFRENGGPAAPGRPRRAP